MFWKEEYTKFFAKGFQNFSDATSFHGFHELYHAKTAFWKNIWLLVVISALCVTVYQVYSSVIVYMGQSSVTMILPVKPGELIYPPLDVCYIHWIMWIDWKKALTLNFTKESLLYSLSYITNPVFSSSTFDVTKAREDLIKTMTLNNITSLSQLYRNIARSFPMVMALLGGGVLIDDPPFFNNITFRLITGDIYLCYSVSGNEIVNIMKQNRGNAFDITRSGIPEFNFSIQDPNYERDFSSFMNENEYDFRVANWLSKKTNYWLPQLSDYYKNYTAFTFPVRMFPDAYSDNYIEISKENDEYSVEMSPSVHRTMSTSKSPCVVGTRGISSEHICKDICRATYEKNMKMCLQLPLAILLGDDTPDKMCSNKIVFLDHLDNFSNTQQSTAKPQLTTTTPPTSEILHDTEQLTTDFQACLVACDNPCEIWKYQYSKSVTTLASEARKLSFKNQTDVQITYPEENDVLVMIDADARTWEDFVGNVGGLLGVWTGASIISFIELFYLCCCKEMEFEMCTSDVLKNILLKKSRANNSIRRISTVLVSSREQSATAVSKNMPTNEMEPPSL